MARSIMFTPDAWEQYQYWQQNDVDMLQRINMLIKDCQRSPFNGIGKPEPLKENFKGYWRRRVNQEHRLVYKVYGNILESLNTAFIILLN